MKFPHIFKFSRISFGIIVFIILSVGGIALGTIERNSRQLSELLAERGLGFIELFERIIYSSIRNNRPFEIDTLSQEMLEGRNILFLAIADEDGKILLHTDHERIGDVFNFSARKRAESGTLYFRDKEVAKWAEVDIQEKPTLITYLEFDVPKPLRNLSNNRRMQSHSHSSAPTPPAPPMQMRENFTNLNISPQALAFFQEVLLLDKVYVYVGQDMIMHSKAKKRADFVVLSVSVAIVLIIITAILLQQYVSRHEAEKKSHRTKLNAISDLTAGVAHEIRNPLSSIKGYATFFKQKFDKGSNEEMAATIMIEEVDRLNRAIDELVGLSRSIDVELQHIDIVEICTKLCHLLEPEMQDKSIDLKCLFNTNTPVYVQADADKIRQALLNIVLNASEAFEKSDKNKTIHFELIKKNKQVLITIIDNGSGIKPQIIDRVFDPYFTTKTQGTGLGLVMVKNIIEAHKGELDISSPSSLADPHYPDRNGTEVSITLLLA